MWMKLIFEGALKIIVFKVKPLANPPPHLTTDDSSKNIFNDNLDFLQPLIKNSTIWLNDKLFLISSAVWDKL